MVVLNGFDNILYFDYIKHPDKVWIVFKMTFTIPSFKIQKNTYCSLVIVGLPSNSFNIGTPCFMGSPPKTQAMLAEVLGQPRPAPVPVLPRTTATTTEATYFRPFSQPLIVIEAKVS